jgi:hypothetical protein
VSNEHSDKPEITFCSVDSMVSDLFQDGSKSLLEASEAFDIRKIQNVEMTVEFTWEQPKAFGIGTAVTIDGVLCHVVSVGSDGSVTLMKAAEKEAINE